MERLFLSHNEVHHQSHTAALNSLPNLAELALDGNAGVRPYPTRCCDFAFNYFDHYFYG